MGHTVLQLIADNTLQSPTYSMPPVTTFSQFKLIVNYL